MTRTLQSLPNYLAGLALLVGLGVAPLLSSCGSAGGSEAAPAQIPPAVEGQSYSLTITGATGIAQGSATVGSRHPCVFTADGRLVQLDSGWTYQLTQDSAGWRFVGADWGGRLTVRVSAAFDQYTAEYTTTGASVWSVTGSLSRASGTG